MRILTLMIAALLLIGGAVLPASVQAQDESCPALIEQALGSVGNNCGDLARNSACYGFDNVEATFTEAATPITFEAPSDRAELTTLKNIGTSPLDRLLETWGIALLSLQANLPETLPGQNTVFMLLGNTQVENAVAPEDRFAGGTIVNVLTNSTAGLFYSFDTSEEVVASIPGNRDLQADAISPDGTWVRVVFEGVPGWVTRNVLEANDAIDTLPVITPETRTPMQAFYLRTSLTGTECTEAPDSLVVQGPQNITVDINVNGADVRLGSTIALRVITLTDEIAALFAPFYADIHRVTRLLEVFVIDGEAILYPGTPEEVIVPTGYRTMICLSETDNLGQDGLENDREVIPGCGWLPPVSWRDTDYETFGELEGFILNYEIRLPSLIVPTLTPIATLTPTPTRTQPPVYYPPTNTPTPTATVIPFESLTSTVTNTPTPTSTFNQEQPLPSDTPTPTITPDPTATDTPTITPDPTATDTPTNTPVPTATNTPTNTPAPTATNTPTNTPVPIPLDKRHR